MPSLFASRSLEQPRQGKTFSRVNSFKREWGDDDENTRSKVGLKGSSRELSDWSPSPEAVKRKIEAKANSAVPYPLIPGETAADRRRKAILGAMSQNTSTAEASSSFSTRHPSPPPIRLPRGSFASRSANGPSARLASHSPPPQDLPSLPSLTERAALLKKREMPWEEEMGTAKRAMRTVPNQSVSNGRSDSASSTSHLNIQQKLSLSVEQQKVLNLVVAEGRSIFFTGSAGTGKSVLLREIIKNLRKKFATAPDAVAVTASTGIAACNIGGVTLHSFGGAGLGIEKTEVLVSKIKKNKKASARWLRTKVLIIDEVSMVDADLFDKFYKIGQALRKNPNKPWGGIQVVVTGDFFQLPPVTKGNAMPKFCFEADTWKETISMSVNLTKVFRQKDERFVTMLNEMRFGKLTRNSIQEFMKLSRGIIYEDGIEPTELFPRREDVDRANTARLNQLNTDGWTYVSVDGGAVVDPLQREKLLGNFLATQSILLKTESQVMLIKNVDETLVNGSMGRIIGFTHKINFFTDSSGRWRPDGGDEDDSLDDEAREKKKRILVQLQAKTMAGSMKPLPVVQFRVPGGGLRDMLVEPDTFKSELPNGEVQVSRNQLPLILAWAMSIHKSQGQTLERVKVDLGKVFEKGQAYVALSRATSLAGLQVTGFTADKVMAHRKVAVWSASLRDLNA